MILPHRAVRLSAQADHDIAKHSVVHIQTALPDHLSGIDPEFVPLLNMIIKKRRAEIVRRGDRMEVSGKMQVQILHGNHLGIAAAGRSSLNAEARPERRLSEGDDRLFPELSEGLSQPYAGGGLSLARRRGIDGRHQDQLPVRTVLDGRHEFLGKLRLVLSVKLQIVRADPELFRHPCNGLHDCFLRDLNICFHL